MPEQYNVIAIIPARGGSKRVPGKNLLPLAGKPLLVHSILHAQGSRYINTIYVSTEDAEIARVAGSHDAEVVIRPLELAGDEATSESALLHVLDHRIGQGLSDPDLVVFLQCTSPVRRSDDIDKAINKLLLKQADSLFSACENNRLIWAVNDDEVYSITYDYRKRKREQDMEKQYRENGSIYIFRPEILRSCNNRLGGRIAVYEMDYWSSFQVDTPEQVELLEHILRRPEYTKPKMLKNAIDLIVFDFDGVMTDNTVSVSEDGIESVRCHRGDGLGIAELHNAGIPMLVISTEENKVVASRCAKLNLPCHQGIPDKAAHLANYLKENGIEPTKVAYMGNDVNDLECMRLVGLPVAVADAHPDVISISHMVLSKLGGHGAVREFTDLLLASGISKKQTDSLTF